MGFITRIDARGRVVIPEGVRKNLNLETGTILLVSLQGDCVILKRAYVNETTKSGTLVAQNESSELQKFLKNE